MAEERVPKLRHNEDIVAHITAGARKHLHCFLDGLRKNALYCDTDFVIFIQPRAKPWPIATGDKLGYMQTQLKHSEHIVAFVCGAKNNAYRVIANEW